MHLAILLSLLITTAVYASLSAVNNNDAQIFDKKIAMRNFLEFQYYKQKDQLMTFNSRERFNGQLTFMTWNIHEAYLEKNGEKTGTWKKIWADILVANPDVLALQEFPIDRLKDITPKSQGYIYKKSCAYS